MDKQPMKVTLGITLIRVIRGGFRGPDLVQIDTNLPPPFPECRVDAATLEIKVPKGTAETWLIAAFGAKPDDVIDLDAPVRI